ncbi:YhcN/YlaJ family sporulation lipoprotein [Desertibacillus haloalkaliphilus]|uniref:YhcN/YlaJ family sporulation lipoprotein n=1 Tax=Desertibacillus haloalkaliphilus TaxID=1328930 RepID=UPI001C269383|nr:YhcN/YlaJ family sporulation lipoprotein [Desertibacillus haloalkaliphilus]MBU8906729.1 YhcN/YlaJ family sporulation lipoprotein [Desertibacillus haloalkaliphilus]
MKIIQMIGYIVLIGMITACQSSPPEQQEQHVQNIGQQGMREVDQAHVRDSQTVANHLSELATNVNGVNHAVTVVAGQYAVVGLDVNATLDQSEVGAIKYQVAESLQDDPYGDHVVITADTDILTRLRDMQSEIDRGKPAHLFLEELASIVGRLMPITSQ